jgi:hypothetical protein
MIVIYLFNVVSKTQLKSFLTSLFVCFTHNVFCFKRYNETTRTINYLVDERRYDKRVRPYHQEKVVMVTVGMTIVNFGQIREKDMVKIAFKYIISFN